MLDIIKKIKFLKLSFFLFFFTLNSFADEDDFVPIDQIPYRRTHKYSSGPYGRIIICSAPRTGSTLLANVLRFLFEEEKNLKDPIYGLSENKVVKVHCVKSTYKKYKLDNPIFFIPIRNPFDSLKSTLRAWDEDLDVAKVRGKRFINTLEKFYLNLFDLKSQFNSLVEVDYELFSNDLEFLLEIIEKQFSISIDSQDKQLLKYACSKENMLKNSQLYSNFKEYNVLSGIHGLHVSEGTYSIDSDLEQFLIPILKEKNYIFKRFGIETLD
jgi:hypothetical protein